MPHQVISKESGPKGTRCVNTLSWTGLSPYQRPRTWRSAWYNTGNEHRDFYLAEMEMQRRIREAIDAGIIPR